MGDDNSWDQELKTYLKIFKTLQTPTKRKNICRAKFKNCHQHKRWLTTCHCWTCISCTIEKLDTTQELTLTTYRITKLQHLEPINSKPCEYSSTCIFYHHANTCKILWAFAHFSLLQPVRSFNFNLLNHYKIIQAPRNLQHHSHTSDCWIGTPIHLSHWGRKVTKNW